MGQKRRGKRDFGSARAVFSGLALVLPWCLSGVVCAQALGSADTVYPAADSVEQTLATVRDCMARSRAPWPDAWASEYVATIREAANMCERDCQYAARLDILREGFSSYWEALKKNQDRSHFEVRRAQIRWCVENLMDAGLPGEEETQTLRHQYEDLAEHAAGSLLAQFSFLDPNMVREAKADHLAECYRNIDAPLLPIFLTPFSEAQVEEIKQRWHKLRYARVDLWRKLGGRAKALGENRDAPSVRTHPDYLLTRRSLEQLRPQIWASTARAPDYYRSAVANHIAAQKRRLELMSQARRKEMQIGNAVLQTEYVSFLLAALLETVESAQEEGE